MRAERCYKLRRISYQVNELRASTSLLLLLNKTHDFTSSKPARCRRFNTRSLANACNRPELRYWKNPSLRTTFKLSMRMNCLGEMQARPRIRSYIESEVSYYQQSGTSKVSSSLQTMCKADALLCTGFLPDEISAAVSHTAHLVRLMALYLDVSLPFIINTGPKLSIRAAGLTPWQQK